MASARKLFLIGVSLALALLFLYAGIFYYQHERSGQQVTPSEKVATSTQEAASGGSTGIATSTSDSGTKESTSTAPIPPSTAPVSQTPCRVSGCSGEICAEGNLVSTCIYKPEYACYRTAKCEQQNTGVCGWTETPELLACVAEKQNGGNKVLTPQ